MGNEVDLDISGRRIVPVAEGAHRNRPTHRRTQSGATAQLAACRLLTFALMEPLPDLVKLRLAHDAGQAEQQAVMVGAGIIETFAVGNDNAEERAQIEELMPIAVVAGKPGSVKAED